MTTGHISTDNELDDKVVYLQKCQLVKETYKRGSKIIREREYTPLSLRAFSKQWSHSAFFGDSSTWHLWNWLWWLDYLPYIDLTVIIYPRTTMEILSVFFLVLSSWTLVCSWYFNVYMYFTGMCMYLHYWTKSINPRCEPCPPNKNWFSGYF